MKYKYWLIPVVVLSLGAGAYFSLAKKVQENQNPKQDLIYENQSLGEAAFEVKYPESWRLAEKSSGNLGEAKDQISFRVDSNQTIQAKVYKNSSEQSITDLYNIESQQQTEVARLLANHLIGSLKSDTAIREEIIIARNGDYLYLFSTNAPGSQEFFKFLSTVTIKNNLNNTEVVPDETKKPIYKIYFGLQNKEKAECSARFYREVYLEPQAEEIAFIPITIKALLAPDQLKLDELNLFTGIPEGTKLLSFGYDNNRAIVNFSEELVLEGDDCSFQLRRSQIEKTLLSLSEITKLQIKSVEIQVEGQVW